MLGQDRLIRLNSEQNERPIKQILISKVKKIRPSVAKEGVKPDWDGRLNIDKKILHFPSSQDNQPIAHGGVIPLDQGKLRKIQIGKIPSSASNAIDKRCLLAPLKAIVQMYLGMQDKSPAVDLESDPKVLEAYLDQLQRDINAEWQAKGIPHFHRRSFAAGVKGLPKKQIVEHALKELKQLKKERSTIQVSCKVVAAREVCLAKVKESVEKLSEIKGEGLVQALDDLSELLKDLRILSLETVEQILLWRESILVFHKQKNLQNIDIQLPFYYSERNYLLKMRDDIKFLALTHLRYHARLSATVSDPFLLSIQISQTQTDPLYVDAIQIVHDCSQLIPRIRASELILFEESLLRRVREQFGDYAISPLKIHEEAANSFISGYFEQIHMEIRNCFADNAEGLLKQASEQQEISFLKIESAGQKGSATNGDSFQGLAVICIDKEQFQLRRSNILHVSCIEKSSFNSILNTLVDFIWKNDSADEITITIYHQEMQEENEKTTKLKLDPFVKNILGVLGFKWKQLLNDPTSGKRSTLFGLKRPIKIPAPQKKMLPGQQFAMNEPIQFCSSLVLSERQALQTLSGQNINNYDAPFHLAKAIAAIKDKTTLEKIVAKCSNQDTILKAYGGQDFEVKGAILEKGTEEEGFNAIKLNEFCSKVFPDTSISLQPSTEGNQCQTVACIANNCYRWKNFSFSSINHKKYIKIKSVINNVAFGGTDQDNSMKRFFSKEDPSNDNSALYLIPTDDEAVNLFLLKLNNEDESFSKLKNKEIRLSEYVGSKIQKCDQNETISKELWIPSVSVTANSHSIPEIQINSIKYAESRVFFSIDYQPQIDLGLITASPTENSLIWKAPFIMGLFHSDLSSKLDYPMISFLIEEEDG